MASTAAALAVREACNTVRADHAGLLSLSTDPKPFAAKPRPPLGLSLGEPEEWKPVPVAPKWRDKFI